MFNIDFFKNLFKRNKMKQDNTLALNAECSKDVLYESDNTRIKDLLESIKECKGDSDSVIEIDKNVETIDDLNLSARGKNVLKINGIVYLNQLVELSRSQLNRLNNLGKNTLEEIILKLESYGYKLKEETDKNIETMEDINLSAKGKNVLKINGINKIKQLLELSISDLYCIENLGKKTTREIILQLESAGYKFKDEIERNISELDLSVRGENALRSSGIKYINQLVELSISDLYCVKNLGENTIEEIILKLESLGYKLKDESIEKEILSEDYINFNFIMSMRFIEKIFGYNAKRNFSDDRKQEFLKRLDNSLSTLAERSKEILICRYGIIDGKLKTLEEVSSIYGVTRERIRQIEVKSLKKLEDLNSSKILRTYFTIKEDEKDSDLSEYILNCVKIKNN